MTDTTASNRRTYNRSPSYPGVPLDFAITKAKKLWDDEQQRWALVSTIMKKWDYAPKSGPGSVTFAALKKYGLIEDEGQKEGRKARLTDLARDILLSPNKEPFIRAAALNPDIHQQMYDQYLKDGTGLPNDDTLVYELVSQGFTPAGASEFTNQFRKTVAFAGLAAPGSVHSDQDDVADENDESDDDSQTRRRKKRKERGVSDTMEITIPLRGMEPVEMTLPNPITEKAWDQMIRVLEAMKDGLVDEEAEEAD